MNYPFEPQSIAHIRIKAQDQEVIRTGNHLFHAVDMSVPTLKDLRHKRVGFGKNVSHPLTLTKNYDQLMLLN